MKLLPTIFISIIFSYSISAQKKIIKLVNASFEVILEDDASLQKEVLGWHGCEMGTTPDILPGQWNVWNLSSDGKHYVGLCTREEGTWESIGQRTSETLKQNECYEFSIDLAHSKTYAGYNKPVKLRIWGSNSICEKAQLLEETKFIDHSDWQTYKVNFFAKKDINYLILEAYYSSGKFNYKGNILIDNLSVIKTCIRA